MVSEIRGLLELCSHGLDVLRESEFQGDKKDPRHILKRGIIDDLIGSLGDKAVTAVESGMASAMTQGNFRLIVFAKYHHLHILSSESDDDCGNDGRYGVCSW